MYKLKIPLIFGPAGGGQIAPLAFKKYFKQYWNVEEKRELVSRFLLKFNPAFRNMIKSAKHVLISNVETRNLVFRSKMTNSAIVLDGSLPESFFPVHNSIRNDGKKLKLLWIGRLLPRKGILLVTEVMTHLRDYPDISLTIVGDGEMRTYLEQEIKQLGLSNVYYHGAVLYEKVKEYYASHDVFFFTSLRDSGGVQLLEAMAYGLPIVTLKLHGQDAIVNEEVGIKCPAIEPLETVNALKNAILSLYFDREKLNKMSQAAFQYAKKQTWDNQIQQVVNKFY
jgi:glycosyltransferase involved in cell wall biosynthesis